MSDDAPAVYRGMRADALQAQYSARTAVPEHPAIFERWAHASAAYRDRSAAAGRARLNLAYGRHPRERIDLFLPESAAPSPLHVFFHGGYWQSMEKSNFSFIAAGPNAAGLAVAVVGYPLCPEVTLERIVTSARAAIAWLARADIAEIRSVPMHVAGHSAGGHLAAMLAITDWQRMDASMPPQPLSGIAPVSGLFDLEPLVHTRMNDALGLDLEAARALSPLGAAPPSGLRVDAFAGGEESDEFKRQSRTLAAEWKDRNGAASNVHLIDGCNHFTVVDALYANGGPMIHAAL